MSFIPIYIYLIALSFIVALFIYKTPPYPYLKLFPPFLFATLVAEVTGSYLWSIKKNNNFIYNFFTVIEFCFYMFLLSLIINNLKAKKYIRVCAIFYALISVSNIIFFQGMKMFHTITYSLGCLLIVAVCIYYFLELFRSPKAIKLSKDPAFWICSGLLFFYCCGFPLYAFINFWARFKWMTYSFENIFTILNIFLYSLFTIAFLCNKTRNYISSPS
jgi:hypothetical protein